VSEGMSPLGTKFLQAQQLAADLMARYELLDWSFTFNRSKRAMGYCRFGLRIIELSRHFVERNGLEVVRDTLLHEIAHALVGPGHGHDATWKQMCRLIGAKPERLSFEVHMPEGRWQAICPGCGLHHHKHRKPKWMVGWFCTHCGKEKGSLTWRDLQSAASPSVRI
jgi:predicted SprT family Zn-dependent metalloprotease